MKKTKEIKYYKGEKSYFLELDDQHKIKIDEEDKTLDGNQLYEIFFKGFDAENNTYNIKNLCTPENQNGDKFCKKIYEKIVQLFNDIENEINKK